LPKLSKESLTAVLKLLGRHVGLKTEALTPNIETAVHHMAAEAGETPDSYVLSLAGGTPGAERELGRLTERLLLGHTHFYRHEKVWKWLEATLPEECPGEVRALVAACSTGEEVYTLSCLLAHLFGVGGFTVTGVDINESALSFARNGVYCRQDIQRLPVPWQERYFEPRQGEFVQVSEALRSRVSFTWANIVRGLPRGPYHLIMTRNVITYFEKNAVEEVLSHIEASVTPPGILATAPQETFLLKSRGWSIPLVAGVPLFRVSAAPQSAEQGPRVHVRPVSPEGVPGPGAFAAAPPQRPVVESSPAVEAPPPSPEPTIDLQDDGSVIEVAAACLSRADSSWAELLVVLRRHLASPPPRLELDLSAVKSSDYHVKRFLGNAVRLLRAGGTRVVVREGPWLKRE
jgi:chemotaxis methyl-accepting protein methylase